MISDVCVYTRASSLGTKAFIRKEVRPGFLPFPGLPASIGEHCSLGPGGKKLQDARPCLLSPTKQCQ